MKNIPLCLLLGTLIVSIIYILTNIAYTALLEILFQNLIDSASQNGYYVTSKTTSTGSTDLTETEAISFMKGKGIDCEISFKEGLFNEVSFTPTAILYTNNPNIPKGIL